MLNSDLPSGDTASFECDPLSYSVTEGSSINAQSKTSYFSGGGGSEESTSPSGSLFRASIQTAKDTLQEALRRPAAAIADKKDLKIRRKIEEEKKLKRWRRS